MRAFTFKKALLAGTAIMAVGGWALSATAADQMLTGPGTWASAGTGVGTDVGDASDASTGDNVDLDTNTLTITNDGMANDGGGVNIFDIGNITDTDSGNANSGDVGITTGANSDLSVTIDSIDIENNVAISNADGNNANVTTTIEGNLTTGTGNGAGTLTITNNDADADVNVNVDVDGDVSIAGATTITANTGATGADATLTIGGGATFTGGVTLDDDTGSAMLIFDGAGAQVVNGAIIGAGPGEGTINVTNDTTVDFNSAIGGTSLLAVNLNNTGVTTFGSTLAATNININEAGTLDLDGGVTGDINFAADGDVIVADGVTITGDINNTSGSTAGTLTFEDTGGTTTVTGNVGATTQLSTISVAGAPADIDFQGTVAANALNISGAGANVNLQDTSTITTVTISNTGTLDVDADAAANVNLSAAGTVDLAATTTLTGAVNNTSGGDGVGTLTVATTGGTTTVTGAVGGSNSLAQATINGTGTAAFGSAVNVDDLDLGGAATVNFAGDVTSANGVDLMANNGTINFADGADLSGNISSTGGATGTLNFAGDSTVTGQVGLAGGTAISALAVNGAGSTVTITGDSFLGTIATIADSTLAFGGDVTASGAITNNGAIGVAVGKTLTAASFGGAGTYNIALQDDGDDILNAVDFGSLASAGAIDLGAETVVFNITGDVAEGAAVVLGAGGAPAVDALSVSDTSILYDVALAAVGTDHQLTVTRNTIASLATSGNNQAAGAVLDGLAGTTNTQLGLVLDQAAAATTSAQLNEVIEATTPTVDAGAVVAGLSVGSQTTTITNTRLASLRSGTTPTGMVAGNISQGLKAWGQVFGSSGEQDDRDGIDGYEVDTLGVAGGVDTETLMEDAVFGLAFSWGNTDVESQNANATETEVTSYQASLYGDYEIDNHSYVSGQLGYVWGNNEQTRHNVGATNLNAQGDYDSNQIIAYAETGRSYQYGHATITPKFLMNYVHYSADEYTETGAGGAGLRNVESEDMDLFEIGIGADASWLYKNADGSYTKPVVRAGVRHDLIGDKFETTSSFIGGGASFETEGFEPAQTTYELGAGVTYFSTSNWDFTADYDYEFKEDYDAHAALARAAYNF